MTAKSFRELFKLSPGKSESDSSSNCIYCGWAVAVIIASTRAFLFADGRGCSSSSNFRLAEAVFSGAVGRSFSLYILLSETFECIMDEGSLDTRIRIFMVEAKRHFYKANAEGKLQITNHLQDPSIPICWSWDYLISASASITNMRRKRSTRLSEI
ncbi:hypothetical protein F4680DRAFT_116759 [Xylaria scruposa]|nr:hypothetical protein F4680DRAFT_116759 [Xylaria scruposa]